MLKNKISLFLMFIILFSLVTQANFIPERIAELNGDLEIMTDLLIDSKLEMRRLEYSYLEDEIKTIEIMLEKANYLNLHGDDKDDVYLILADITSQLKELEPYFYESLPVETRAIWIDRQTVERFFDRTDIQEHIDQLRDININLILLEVYNHGMTIYPSKVVPSNRMVELMYDGDLLADIISEAHQRGIEIHPYVRVFGLHYGAEHFIDEKLHWLDKTRSNEYTLENGFYWLSPIQPEVRDYKIAMLRELTENYNVDGLHLDYIRFDAGFGYNQYSRELFKSLFGIDPFDINTQQMEDTFTVFKAQFVNRFVERAFNELKAIQPHLILSAAVSTPFVWLKLEQGQDWPNWAENRMVHFVTPMAYRYTAKEYVSVINSDINTTNGTTFLFPGLGVYLFDSTVLLEQIKAAQNIPITGQAIFSATSMKKSHFDALEQGSWRDPAFPTFRDPQKAAGLILQDLVQRIQEFAVFDQANDISSSYLHNLGSLAEEILEAKIRRWDTRDLREQEDDEAILLQDILSRLSQAIDITAKFGKDGTLSHQTVKRVTNDLEQVKSLLDPLYYTSLPFEFIPTTVL